MSHSVELKDFDRAWFLREIWQQQPLVIRNAFTHWQNPLSPDELAGLACEEGVEARLVTHLLPAASMSNAAASTQPHTLGIWSLEHGPFPEERFTGLPTSDWTLLVQAVDHWVPEVAALIEPFRFLPDWRIDDVMVSYADDGGGVGPHFDQYDVFLIQGLGQRRWQVGPRCDHLTPLHDNPQLRLLAEFEATEEWILEPGDILYVPPRFAHNGVAIGNDCMTYSVGFRAPGQAELISHWCDHVLETVTDDERFQDTELTPVANPGEITAAALEQLRQLALEKLTDSTAFQRWFGTFTTTPKYPNENFAPDVPHNAKTLLAQLQTEGVLHRNPASRFAFIRDIDVILFVDGDSYHGLETAFVEMLCAQTLWEQQELLPWLNSNIAVELLCTLFNQGSIHFDESDTD